MFVPSCLGKDAQSPHVRKRPILRIKNVAIAGTGLEMSSTITEGPLCYYIKIQKRSQTSLTAMSYISRI